MINFTISKEEIGNRVIKYLDKKFRDHFHGHHINGSHYMWFYKMKENGVEFYYRIFMCHQYISITKYKDKNDARTFVGTPLYISLFDLIFYLEQDSFHEILAESECFYE